MTIGERIAKFREKRGMSQEDLAHLLGYKSRSTISKIEKSERNVPKKMISQLSLILGVTPLSILTDVKKSQQYESNVIEATGKSYVYKYVCNGEIIYIGKSDYSLINRLNCHKSEEKFLPYLKKTEIYYAELPNPAMATIFETYLINKYKPKLNESMKYKDEMSIDIPEPKWETWDKMPTN